MKKTLIGTIKSDKMTDTAVVAVTVWKVHPIMHKRYRRTKSIMAHNQDNAFKAGMTVEIAETKPISRHKSWIITKEITVGGKGE